MRELVEEIGSDLQGQTRLSDSTCARHGHEPRRAQQTMNVLNFPLAANEARQLNGQIAGNHIRWVGGLCTVVPLYPDHLLNVVDERRHRRIPALLGQIGIQAWYLLR